MLRHVGYFCDGSMETDKSAKNNTKYFKVDISDYREATDAYDKIVIDIGYPTILVTNAGYVGGDTILNTTESKLKRTFGVNVLGVL